MWFVGEEGLRVWLVAEEGLRVWLVVEEGLRVWLVAEEGGGPKGVVSFYGHFFPSSQALEIIKTSQLKKYVSCTIITVQLYLC